MMAEVFKPASGRGETDGAMFLAVEKMEQAGGENDDKNDDHGLFHVLKIIPRPAIAVNTLKTQFPPLITRRPFATAINSDDP